MNAAFERFARLCEQLAATSKRLEKRSLIAEYLKSLAPEDASKAALYLSGQPFAETDRRTLNVRGSALSKAVGKTWESSVLTLKMLGKMILGEVSWKNITGPITIADYAGQTARVGMISYLSFIAFISISLGVMNLLPIPVLDGGLLLYYSLEVLTGRTIPERIGDMAQRAGVGILMTLMAVAVFNDIVRLIS